MKLVTLKNAGIKGRIVGKGKKLAVVVAAVGVMMGAALTGQAHADGPYGYDADSYFYYYPDSGYVYEEPDSYGTGVWVNGIELTREEVTAIEMHFQAPVLPGIYWLDSMGNYGLAGGPAVGNLYYGYYGQSGHDSSYYGYSDYGQSNGGWQSGGWESGGMEDTQFGYVGGGNYFDGETGCSYIPGSGVSC